MLHLPDERQSAFIREIHNMDAVGLLFSTALNRSPNNYQFMSFTYDMDCAFGIKSESKSFDTGHLINTFIVFSYYANDHIESLNHTSYSQNRLDIITNSNKELQLQSKISYASSNGYYNQFVSVNQSIIKIALSFTFVSTDPNFTPSTENRHIYSSLFGLCIFM